LKNFFIYAMVAQHAEESSSLWLLRDRAANAPHYSLKELAKLDGRVEAHIDGLRVAGDAGWEICREALGGGDSGELFAAAVPAFESGLDERIEAVLAVAEEKPETCRGLVSALGWLSWERAEVHCARLIADESPLFRCVGLSACAAHRRDPGRPLIDALKDVHPVVRARALQAVGELGRKDLLPFLLDYLNSDDDLCRYGAASSAALLGDAGSAKVLKRLTTGDFPWPEDALTMAVRRMSLPAALEWQGELAGRPGAMRLAVIAAGAIGDPVLVPWIVERMALPELARIAGESFTMITGVDIAYADLNGERPEGFESGPTEEPEDEAVEMDADEDLPWPDPQLIQGWWEKNGAGFRSGDRYLMGRPIGYDHLEQILRSGRQRQRRAAAMEMSMLNPGLPLFEVRAPGFRQQRLLGLK